MAKVVDLVQVQELLEALRTVRDPRVEGRCRHLLEDVLALSVIAVLCGAESIVDIAEFGRAKETWLRKFLKLPHGIPSHDTIARVLSILNTEELNQVFADWVKSIIDEKGTKTVSVDGKSTKGTERGFNKKHRPLHTVSVYSHELGLTLCEEESNSSGNAEVGAAMRCIELLDLKGATVLGDAAFARPSFVEKIRAQGGHYILPVKLNSKGSYEELEDLFSQFKGQKKRAVEEGHGRREERTCHLLSSKSLTAEFKDKWPGVKSVFVIHRIREDEDKRYSVQKRDKNGKTYYEVNENFGGYKSKESRVFYVSSKALTPDEALVEVRKHWSIENNLHWVLDVAFREDSWSVRSKKLAKKLSLIRKIALNLIRSSPTKGSVRIRIKRAGWDTSFLEQLLFGGLI